MGRLELHILGPDNLDRRIEVPAQALTIGRGSRCDLTLDSPLVSRHHATLRRLGSGVLELEDLSVNGTLVAGQLTHRERRAISHGTLIHVGPFCLVPALATGSAEMPASEPATESDPAVELGTSDVSVELRRAIHRQLLDNLDLVKLERSRMNEHMLRAKVKVALEKIIGELAEKIPAGTDTELLIRELTDEALGLGPLEELLADDKVSEIMVIDPHTIYVERGGRVELTPFRFTDDESVRSVIERVVTPLGRRIDESSPMLDARLPDGSRVNAVIKPLALRGTCITIRKFTKVPLTAENLIEFGSITVPMMRFLHRSVRVRKNLLISGGTGSGKTSLLNVLSAAIPNGERIVTIEDAAELRLSQSHVVPLEARPPNIEGRGAIPIRELVKNAMRMRPDRIIVGECRGGEALDMLQAMNTGHEGSMTTAHANSPLEALKRVETLALMAGLELPSRAIREQLALAVHLLVHLDRFSDGSRRVTSIAEVVRVGDDGEVEVREIFGFRRTGTGENGRVLGEYFATGFLPSYVDEFIKHGLVGDGDAYL